MLCSRHTIHVHNFNKHFDRKLKGKGLNKVAVLFDQAKAKKDSNLAEIQSCSARLYFDKCWYFLFYRL